MVLSSYFFGNPRLMAHRQASFELLCFQSKASNFEYQNDCPFERSDSNKALCTREWCNIRFWQKWNQVRTCSCCHISNTPKENPSSLTPDALELLCDLIWPYAKGCDFQTHLYLFHCRTICCNLLICIAPHILGRGFHNTHKMTAANCQNRMVLPSFEKKPRFGCPCYYLRAYHQLHHPVVGPDHRPPPGLRSHHHEPLVYQLFGRGL